MLAPGGRCFVNGTGHRNICFFCRLSLTSPSRPRFLSTSKSHLGPGPSSGSNAAETSESTIDSSWGGLAKARRQQSSNDNQTQSHESRERSIFSNPPSPATPSSGHQPASKSIDTSRSNDTSTAHTQAPKDRPRFRISKSSNIGDRQQSDRRWPSLNRKSKATPNSSSDPRTQSSLRPNIKIRRQDATSGTKSDDHAGDTFVGFRRAYKPEQPPVSADDPPQSLESESWQSLQQKSKPLDSSDLAESIVEPASQKAEKGKSGDSLVQTEDKDERMRRRFNRLGLTDVDEEEPSFAEQSRRQMQQSVDYQKRNPRSSNRYRDDDYDEPDYGQIEKKKAKPKVRRQEREKPIPIELPPYISVQNLATALKVRSEAFIEKLEDLGFEDVAVDHVLNLENAALVAMEYNYEVLEEQSEMLDLKARPPPIDKEALPSRPPVVTIMGHVDHGKTTILDYMRKSSVAASEHGGITQHIGAFSVSMGSGKLVTFLDTPGHAAFLSMRQRGANVTDIVILVVAADDSVKPQTIEALKHAKAAKVPIIVAINKVDKPEADVEQVKQDLLRHDIEVEDFGGDIQAVPVSGKTGQGINDLIEAMDSQAEILDLRAEKDGQAEGWVLEAEVKKAGRVATVLVRRGTLRPGDIIVAGKTWARIRSLRNEAGVSLQEVGAGMPAEIDGWRSQPVAGDEVLQAKDEKQASTTVEYREERDRRTQAAIDAEAINESRRQREERRERERVAADTARAEVEDDKSLTRGQRRVAVDQAVAAVREQMLVDNIDDRLLYFVIKSDVGGSAEAVAAAVEGIPLDNQPLGVEILRSGVGQLSESDVSLASAVPAGRGFLVNFNQPVPPHISQAAERAGVQILDDNIIYRVTDGVRKLVEERLPPIVTKRVLGEVLIAQLFDIRVGKKTVGVAGCKVRNGVLNRTKKVRVFRGDVGKEENIVFDGMLSSLKNQKKDVQEMRKGTECGVSFEGWEEFMMDDVIQCYEEHQEKRYLTA